MARVELYKFYALTCDACGKEGPRVSDVKRDRPDGDFDEVRDPDRGTYRESTVKQAMKDGNWKEIGKVTLCPDCRKGAGL